MHKEILTKKQANLLPFLKPFSKDFGLVGGTAIALHLGHRQSIDFDLFTNKEFNNTILRKKIKKSLKIEGVVVDKFDEFTFISQGVKITFLYYPYKIKYSKKIDNIIKTPDLLTLAAMKAYALGRRVKWKDYVDLYFIIKNHFSVSEISKKALNIFSTEFNEKIFRTQLSYFKDIDYSEKVAYVKGFKTDDKIIKKDLIDFSLKN